MNWRGHRATVIICSVPDPLPPANPRVDWQQLFFKVVLLGSLGVLSLWLIIRLSVVTVPILIGLFIAYALNPAVVVLRRWRVPSVLALGVPLLAVLALATVFAVLVVPSMTHEILFASQHAPQKLYNVVLKCDPWFLAHFGKRLSSLIDYNSLSGLTQSMANETFGHDRTALVWVLSSARDAAVALANLVLVVVVAFFLLDDYERIVKAGADLVPVARLAEVSRIVKRIDRVLAGFLRGQLLLFLAATITFTGGLLVLEVPFAPVMGPLAAVLYLVPYVGVLTGTLLCALLSGLAGQGIAQVLGVLLLFGAFYGLDLLIITPRLIGNRVGLKPIVVLLGIIAFGQLFGTIGVLLAVPVLASGRILVLELMERYRASAAYRGAPPVGDEPPPP